MASRILLISANSYAVPYPVFPLGLAQLDVALRGAGHQVEWIDCLADTDPVEERVRCFQPDVVGVSLRNIDDVAFRKQATFHGTLVTLCQRIRQCRPGCRIVVGGSGFSIFPRELLGRSGADFGVQGEGEAGLLALLDALEQGTNYRQIPGLVFRDEGEIKCNPQRPARLDDTNTLPERPEHLVDYYLQHSLMLNLQTQRGCGFECCYCTYPLIEGRRHRRRAAAAVAEEFARLADRGVPYVFVVDSVFNSSPAHVIEICEAILERGVQLKWGCFLRPQGLDHRQMELLAAAGLSHIEFGSDSFSDRVLSAYRKHLQFADIRASAELAAAHKIEQCHFLILGGPGETRDTLEETLRNSRQLPDAVVLPVVGMRVYPGTAVYDEARRLGVLPTDEALLEPFHFVAPGLDAAFIQDRLQTFVREHPNWIVGEPPASFHRLVQRLRSRQIAGPLWTYFAMLQKLPPNLGTP